MPHKTFLDTATLAFATGSYAMALCCLYHAFRQAGFRLNAAALAPQAASGGRDLDARDAGTRSWTPIVAYALFAGFLFFLESWAHFRTPYYVYTPSFPDLIPRLDIGRLTHIAGPLRNACVDQVLGFQKQHNLDMIPLSVVLFEASLCYVGWQTAETLSAHPLVQPFVAGLMLVTVDSLLDPVLASSVGCNGLPGQLPSGIGLWAWHVPTLNDVSRPDENALAAWFGVPLFNFAAWLGAPVFLVACVNLVTACRNVPTRRTQAWGHWSVQPLLLAAMAASVGAVFAISPNQNLRVEMQWTLLLILVGGAAAITFLRLRSAAADNRACPSLTRPVVTSLLIPLTLTSFIDQPINSPALIAVGFTATGLALWIVWTPYRSALTDFRLRLDAIDRTIRLHYFGFSAMLVLLGAALVDRRPSTLLVSTLLLTALAFQVYSYVLNDYIDYAVDSGPERRSDDPLRNGQLSLDSAFAIAMTAAAASVFLVVVAAGSFQRAIGPLLALVPALIFMAVYNRYGKAIRFTPITDLVQGVAWGLLVAVGALVADPDGTLSQIPWTATGRPAQLWLRVLCLSGYGVCYIFLINGIHGGLRDLVTDKKGGGHTTAMLLGASATGSHIRSSPGVIIFSYLVQTMMFACVGLFLVLNAEQFSHMTRVVTVASSLALLNYGLLWPVVKLESGKRNAALSRHLFWLLVIPMSVFLQADAPHPVFKWTVVMGFAVPLLLQNSVLEQLFAFFYDRSEFRIPAVLRERRTVRTAGLVLLIAAVAAVVATCTAIRPGSRKAPLAHPRSGGASGITLATAGLADGPASMGDNRN